jgi:hypothetical protein
MNSVMATATAKRVRVFSLDPNGILTAPPPTKPSRAR